MLAHAIAVSAALDRTLVLPPFVWMASQVHLHHHNNKDIDNIRVATVAGRRAALVCYVALLRTLRSPPLRARRRDGHVRASCRERVWRATAARASVPAVLRCPGASSCRGRAVHRRIFPAIQPAIRRTPADVSIRRGYPGKLRSRRCAVRARRRCHLEHIPRPFTTQENSACGDNFHSNIRPNVAGLGYWRSARLHLGRQQRELDTLDHSVTGGGDSGGGDVGADAATRERAQQQLVRPPATPTPQRR